MDRIAPKPAMITKKKRITHTFPARLTESLTPLERLFETTSMGVPDIDVADWSLDITGLVDRPTTLSFDDLKRLPKREIETVFVCSGNPQKPTVPMRRVANVKWGGVELAGLLGGLGIGDEATHLWAYGHDHGAYAGVELDHFLKDMPVSRLHKGDVLIAYELNGEPLTRNYGFPVRLVIPGYYGTNCVKWLCRLELADKRADSLMTNKLYNDPDYDADPSGKVTKPVWAVAPESVFVSPAPKTKIAGGEIEIWGWAWSNCEVGSAEVSTDGGETWVEAALEAPNGRAWQRFSYVWVPPRAGSHELRCRTTDVKGRGQPADGARNSVYSVTVTVEE